MRPPDPARRPQDEDTASASCGGSDGLAQMLGQDDQRPADTRDMVSARSSTGVVAQLLSSNGVRNLRSAFFCSATA